MGASNVMAAYAKWAGRLPPTSFQCLVYMALVSKDGDARPWFGQGHQALAEHALGRPAPITEADVKAVERAMTPLARAGAISTDRRASVRRDGANTARYRLNLYGPDAPRNAGDVGQSGPSPNGYHAPRKPWDVNADTVDDPPVDNWAEDPPRPPETVLHAPRNSSARPPETVRTPPENRGTEEPGGTTRSEKTKEEVVDLRTDVAVAREPDAATTPEIPPPTASRPPARASPPGRCPQHPAQPAGMTRGRPRCRVCHAQGRHHDPPDLRLVEGGAA